MKLLTLHHIASLLHRFIASRPQLCLQHSETNYPGMAAISQSQRKSDCKEKEIWRQFCEISGKISNYSVAVQQN
jgi:hypothetical protein